MCINSDNNQVFWLNSFNKNIEIQAADQSLCFKKIFSRRFENIPHIPRQELMKCLESAFNPSTNKLYVAMRGYNDITLLTGSASSILIFDLTDML
jgi:hypothetical protein